MKYTAENLITHTQNTIMLILFAIELTLLLTARAYADMCQLPLFHAAHYRFYLFILFCFRADPRALRTYDSIKIFKTTESMTKTCKTRKYHLSICSVTIAQ